jgi:protein-S-isoprenylcysteine O-methyltransferase Ste14
LPASLDRLQADEPPGSVAESYEYAGTRAVQFSVMSDIGKLLVITGVVIAVVGGVLLIGSRFGLGQLPGDISVNQGNFTFVFPVVACILLSVVLTLVLNIIFRLLR